VYNNNAAFYALRVDDGGLRDIDAYAFDEGTQTWSEPHDFDAAWRVDRVDAAAVASIHARLGTDPVMRRAWGDASNGWPHGEAVAWEMWGANWRIPWCAQTEFESGFTACAGLEGLQRFALAALAAVVFLPPLVSAGILIFVLRSPRRRDRRLE